MARKLTKQERIEFELEEREKEILMLRSRIKAYEYFLNSLGVPTPYRDAVL